MLKAMLAVIAVGATILAYRADIELLLAMRGQTIQPEHPSIVMLGDSHTEFVNWPLLMHCGDIANFGIGGNTTTQILDRLDAVIEVKPRLVIMMAGTNDARRYVLPFETIGNITEIREKLAENGISLITLSPPPLPSRGKAVNVSIKNADIKLNFTTDDLLPDQIHMRRNAYAKWHDAILPFVTRFCSPN